VWTKSQLAIKRVFDIVGSAFLLIILAPVALVITLVIWVTSGRPILYEWKVVGKGSKPFTGHKFRTMVTNADELKQQLLDHNEMTGPVFKIKDDPRITPVGRFLRRHSLDELPQFWSVLKGDMSLVGPRPPLQSEFEKFTEWQKQKLAIKPGMTSLWQVSGKPKDFSEWVQLDLEYIDHWSLWLDAKILFRTLLVVLGGENH
jgi:lipopolysaccharide/colanic/teichoic acid biosynthesis glycosyltransferase